eukprot:TRINITY_DN7608_c0_g1_i1.p1 TRINITY_DN7608_c0_g1~~TRINITY_DN7608_c0_g1_i1.p1  ORF type:complete len:616 (-),score=142.75 TRINITY_DN7608_c0_g1_i1:126-1922(-)
MEPRTKGLFATIAFCLALVILTGGFVTSTVSDHFRSQAGKNLQMSVASRFGSQLKHGRALLQTGNPTADRALAFVASLRDTLPRFNTLFQPIAKTFTPTSSEYLFSVGFWGIPGAALGAFFLLIGILFVSGRLCCNCCGTNDVVDWNPTIQRTPYSSSQRCCPKFFLLLFTACVIAGGAIGYIYNTSTSTGLLTTAEGILTGSNGMVLYARGLSDIMAVEFPVLPSSASSDLSTLAAIEASADTVAVAAQNVVDLIVNLNRYRLVAIHIGFIYSMVLCVLGFIAALCNLHFISLYVGVFGFLALLINWCGFGAHLALSIVSSDMCTSINTYVSSNGASTASQSELSIILACVDNTTLVGVRNLTNSMISTQLNNCTSQVTSALGISMTCLGDASVADTNATTYWGRLFTVFPSLQLTSPDVVATVNHLSNFTLALNYTNDLAQCTPVLAAMRIVQGSFCTTVLSGFDILMSVFLAIAASMIGVTIIAIVGFKRFRSKWPNPEIAKKQARQSQSLKQIPMQPRHTRGQPQQHSAQYSQQAPSGYAGPASGYGAQVPSYGAPAAGYAPTAPSSGYAPTGPAGYSTGGDYGKPQQHHVLHF